MGSLFNITMNVAQQSSILKDVLIPLVGVFATLAAGFGGVYYAAKITDKRHANEEREKNIKKTIFLHFLTGEYFRKILDYKAGIIEKQKNALQNSELLCKDMYTRTPYIPHIFPVNVNEYLHINDENPMLLSALSILIHLSTSLDAALKEQDSVLNNMNLLLLDNNGQGIVNMELLRMRLKSLVNVVDKTCGDVLFFTNLLYKNLGILIDTRYKAKFKCIDLIQQRSLNEDAHNNEKLKGWIEGLNKSWNE